MHTPLTYEEKSSERKVGPSDADQKWANSQNVEIVILDYVGTKNTINGKSYINGGHDIDDPMIEYVVKPKKENNYEKRK